MSSFGTEMSHFIGKVLTGNLKFLPNICPNIKKVRAFYLNIWWTFEMVVLLREILQSVHWRGPCEKLTAGCEGISEYWVLSWCVEGHKWVIVDKSACKGQGLFWIDRANVCNFTGNARRMLTDPYLKHITSGWRFIILCDKLNVSLCNF